MSKEEIEKTKRDLAMLSYTHKHFSVIVDNTLKYINQLESREQKLIEKLEEINTRNAELYNSPKQKEVDFSEWNLAQELLEILKKE